MLDKEFLRTCKKYLMTAAVRTGILSRWTFNRYCTDEAKQLGYRESKKLFSEKRTFHNAILRESDQRKRALLAARHYDKIYRDLMAHTPSNPDNEKRTYGFNPVFIEERKDLFRDRIVIDIGCGSGASTEHISRYAKHVYGLEYSSVIMAEANKEFGPHGNIEFRELEDLTLPFEDESIDVAYSNDVIEHLHPDDAFMHLQEVRRVLRTGGQYYFWTPGKKSGPHDFTKNFYLMGYGVPAQASHIKEYDFEEMIEILKQAKFRAAAIPDIKQEVLLIAEK